MEGGNEGDIQAGKYRAQCVSVEWKEHGQALRELSGGRGRSRDTELLYRKRTEDRWDSASWAEGTRQPLGKGRKRYGYGPGSEEICKERHLRGLMRGRGVRRH